MKASDRAYATLLDEIQGGSLPPGTVLAEVEQSERLGVSRTPFREALARLSADGLVVQQSPRVTIVAPIDADEIRRLFEARRALEETTARIAATRGDHARFGALAEQLEQAGENLSSTAGRSEYYELVAELDAAIDAAVDNDYLTSALRTIRTHLVRVRRLASDHPDRLTASVTEHVTIALAIADGNADLAAHATHIHLHNALTSILTYLPENA